MQTPAISNINQNVKFRSHIDPEAQALVNMSDAQLRQLAYLSTDKNEDKRANRAIIGTFLAMPIVDSIANGVLAENAVCAKAKFGELELKSKLKMPASMGERLFKTGGTAVGWAYALGIIGIYSALKHVVSDNSSDVKKFDQQHPVLSFAADLGLIFGACVLGAKGISKLSEKFAKKCPKSAEEIGEKFGKMFENIDKGHFNRKTLPKWVDGFAKFEEKSPILAKTGKFTLANSMWILLGAAIAQMVIHGSKKQNGFEQNYHALKGLQLDAAKQLLKTKTQVKSAENRVQTIKNDYEPEVIEDIEIIKVIHIPDEQLEQLKKRNG